MKTLLAIILLTLASCSSPTGELDEWRDLGLSAADIRAVRGYAQFKEIR